MVEIAPIICRQKSGCPDTKLKRDYFEWDDVVLKFDTVKGFIARDPMFATEGITAKFLSDLTCDVLVLMEAMYGKNVRASIFHFKEVAT